jgi:hypothetical protein
LASGSPETGREAGKVAGELSATRGAEKGGRSAEPGRCTLRGKSLSLPPHMRELE